MVMASPNSTGLCIGWAWGLEELIPLARIVSKDKLDAPNSRMRKSRKLAISISVFPGLIKSSASRKAWSEIEQALRIAAISASSLIIRRPSTN
ncbi:Uncharacterised protein [Streptococcus pneumoniae]|nr:Uncharacterised protein [Streptococcus pneumoniae]